jgi:hypothetical protein
MIFFIQCSIFYPEGLKPGIYKEYIQTTYTSQINRQRHSKNVQIKMETNWSTFDFTPGIPIYFQGL